MSFAKAAEKTMSGIKPSQDAGWSAARANKKVADFFGMGSQPSSIKKKQPTSFAQLSAADIASIDPATLPARE
ncbi:MAG: hypothetical protein ACREVK_01470 [Gammaproteobacteria bacterium]